MHLKLSICAALIGAAFAVPSRRSSTHVLHEKRTVEPRNWELSHRLDAGKVLPMRFGLTQSNVHRVEELLMEVSHTRVGTLWATLYPRGDRGSVCTQARVDLCSDQTGSLTPALRVSGCVCQPTEGGSRWRATTAEVEDLLKTEYHVWNHPSGDQQFGKYLM